MDAKAREVVKRFDEELFGEGRLDVADEILGEDFVFYGPPAGIRGSEAFKAFVQMMRSAFPDLRYETEAVIADSGKVGRLATMRGTHLGDMRGIPPSGKTIAIPRIDTFRFEGDRIVEVRAYLDHEAFFAELRQESLVVPAAV
jgi:steroid delta-isomerase-like uncharacterized protein